MFKQKDLPDFPKLSKEEAQKLFVIALQNAHAGERAATYAYTGHGLSLFIADEVEKAEVLKIRDEEIHHRQRIREILKEQGAEPRPGREFVLACVGFTIGFLCLFGGWLIPMYGAGKLESSNIFEYEVAARLAFLAGHEKYVDELLRFAEIEWDHESYFRKKTESHFLAGGIPLWTSPKAKSLIRADYLSWK